MCLMFTNGESSGTVDLVDLGLDDLTWTGAAHEDGELVYLCDTVSLLADGLDLDLVGLTLFDRCGGLAQTAPLSCVSEPNAVHRTHHILKSLCGHT